MKERLLGRGLAGRKDSRTGAALAADDGGHPDDRREDGFGACVAQRVLGPGEVSAGDVPCFVSEHANDLLRIVGLENEAGEHEDILAPGNECVDARICDEMDPYRCGVDARHRE